eukprot:232696_1
MSVLKKIESLVQTIDNSLDYDSKQSETVTMNSAISKSTFKLYTSWFCPFAQRAQIALEWKQIPYEYIDVDPYNKTKEWLDKNPQGLVPTIFHNNKYIYESIIVLEYLDDAFPENDYKLFPTDPYKKAFNRIMIDHVNKKIIKPFYQILQFQEDRKQEREEAITNYFNQISKLIGNMDTIGPYFNGDKLSAVDIVFLPWATRMFLLEHYRGIQYDKYFKNKDILNRYDQWYNACNSLSCVTATQKSLTITNEQYPNELIKKYQRYADNTAKSMVADAVNNDTAMP